MTLDEAAQAAGVNPSTISRWERNEREPEDFIVVRKLAAAYMARIERNVDVAEKLSRGLV